MYATGYLNTGKKQWWGYGLYNDIVNDNNIQDVYKRIFITIEAVKI